MATKKKWTKKELNDFKKLIIEKRDKVIAELEAAKERADEALNSNSVNAIYSSHMADAGTDQQEMEKNYYWMDRDNKFLQYLHRALDMIKDGTFGVCASCGELINKERLIEVPHTTSCFDCKSKVV
ncbi:MAG: TraR/DksA C4-type zinc finger protein [Candidatus Marinimicrobia bacterium]|jgi:RNA polymerase-binding protein DksA|nr:TraR/DksA C4-type zinc finger protein [Candidatus Neomarinimicrobiota bacterium]MDP6852824.1 TraR/DksA C4-type zinc finger protein [Candidatus Neomarinimicrobiota bacterium]MDP6936076.1 TraR/DksA C4-type zinc finger protein [Candidatus Neomarinimicrobiota bacterium]